MTRKINHTRGRLAIAILAGLVALVAGGRLSAGTDSEDAMSDAPHLLAGRRLFEKETFGGNGRTCETCHSRDTGTVSPEDAQRRMSRDPRDPLFLGDGSDDGAGAGAERILTHATVLVKVPLADNVTLAADSTAATAVVRRGIPTTLNTPALDRVLMWDGRHHNLDEQAHSAILGHAEAPRTPTAKELERIAEFERSRTFFSSPRLWRFAVNGTPPLLPTGRTESEQRGREFFEDVPPGLCSTRRTSSFPYRRAAEVDAFNRFWCRS